MIHQEDEILLQRCMISAKQLRAKYRGFPRSRTWPFELAEYHHMESDIAGSLFSSRWATSYLAPSHMIYRPTSFFETVGGNITTFTF